jgi:predicted GNAT family acetyltransferase
MKHPCNGPNLLSRAVRRRKLRRYARNNRGLCNRVRSSTRRRRRSHILRRGRNIRLSTKRIMSTISHDRVANRFTTEVDGHSARLDYTLSGKVMNITHTRVPPEIGGRGVAADLMRAALEVAQAEGWSINPVCTYASAYMRKHHLATQQGHIDELLDEALDESFPASDSPSVGGSS